ncbi:hypothetical protein AAMO2058_000165200 [Amorphochlora amoebiformis]|mmetsp:Transcript_28207/g.44913  ORF Transcript_28207/g.44913 Transcript_28207/m.44913 type:complete len:640 (-) Transcript_28207:167-2086(-)
MSGSSSRPRIRRSKSVSLWTRFIQGPQVAAPAAPDVPEAPTRANSDVQTGSASVEMSPATVLPIVRPLENKTPSKLPSVAEYEPNPPVIEKDEKCNAKRKRFDTPHKVARISQKTQERHRRNSSRFEAMVNYLQELVVGKCLCKNEAEDQPRVVMLHADPLVSVDATQFSPGKEVPVDVEIPSLPSERHVIEDIFSKSGTDVDIIFRHLSRMSLGEELSSTADITLLHISAHGTLTKDGKYALVLENECGFADFCLMSRLNKLLRHCNVPRCVVISACFSGRAASIFLESGAEHVIVCKEDQRLMDMSARYFNRFFYMALFNGHTVRRAFEIARANVAAVVDSETPDPHFTKHVTREDVKETHSIPESEKFALLPADGNHDVVLFASKPRKKKRPFPRPKSLGKDRSPTTPYPPIPSYAIGRHVQVSRCVSLLRQHRCVNIVGRRRIGKSTIATMCLQYVHEREFFGDGVHYIDLAKVLFPQNLLAESPRSPEASQAAVVEEFANAMQLKRHHPEFRIPKTFAEFFQEMSSWHALFVIDHACCALSVSIASQLLRNTHKPKILITSNTPVDLGTDSLRQVVWARELSKGSGRELIRILAPWKAEEDVAKLLKHTAGSPGSIMEVLESEIMGRPAYPNQI